MDASTESNAVSAKAEESTSSRDSRTSDSVVRLRPMAFLLWTLVAGVVFLAVTWGFFPVSSRPKGLAVPMPSREIVLAIQKADYKSMMINATAAMGVFGLVLSGLLGLGEAAARRFERGSVKGLVVGTVLGAVVGGLGGLLGQWLTEALIPVETLLPMGRTCIVQMVTLAVLGIGVGTAIGLVAGGGRRALSAAVPFAASGVLAGVIYPVVAAYALHKSATEVVVPGGVVAGTRDVFILALWVGLLVLTFGLLVPNVGRRRRASEL